MNISASLAKRGRPREFDLDQALSSALRVFWEKGFEGASLTDLTEAMGIERPSLYAAFGNKEALFDQALGLYEREKLAYIGQAIEAPTSRGVAQRLLEGTIDNTTISGCQGCLGVITMVGHSRGDSTVGQRVLDIAQSARKALVERLQRAVNDGDFAQPVEAEAMTQYLLAVLQGIAVQAGAGAAREDLEQVARATLAIWPSR